MAQVDETVVADLEAILSAWQAELAAKGGAPTDDVSSDEGGATRVFSEAWSQLRPDSLVLAADLNHQGTPEPWYEAEIVGPDASEFTMRWRDFPRDGLFARTRRHIALIHPAI